MKTCTMCGKTFPETSEFFPRNGKCKNGLNSRCKICKNEINREYFIKNAEKIRQRSSAWYILHREKALKSCEQYRKDHKTDVAQTKKRCYEKNKNKYLKYVRNWCRENPACRRIADQRRRGKIKMTLATFTQQEWENTQLFFNNECAYCGSPSPVLHQDHVIPVKLYGEYSKHNIIPSCPACNFSKSSKDMYEWYRGQSFYTPERLSRINHYLCSMAMENGGWGRQRKDLGVLTIFVENAG